MRVVIFAAVLALTGCNTPAGYDVRGGKLCKLGADGRCYHIGDTWIAYRLDNQFRAHRVK